MQVKGDGNVQAKIWLIGEAPGATEAASGKPFVGGAGRVLDGILRDSGIKRDETFIDNVIQWQPQKNDFGKYYEDSKRERPTQELLRAHDRIREDVRLHRPNVVVALGNEALFALTGRKYITKWRGSILGCHGVKVIPTIHPAMVMRQYEFRPVSILDFKRVKEEARTPDFPTPYHDQFLINPTYEQVMETLEFLHTQPYIAFDIETAINQIVCIGFGWARDKSVCIPIFFGSNSWWSKEEELAIIKEIKRLFANTRIKFIAQNAQFDMIFLKDKWDVDVPSLWMDTMIGFHCVYPELRKGLAFLCSIYTKRPYYKGMTGTGEGPSNLWTYNCLDTVVTWECAHEIRKELEEFGTLDFYLQNSHKLIQPLIRMQRRGIKIDLDKRAKTDEVLSKSEVELLERLQKAVGHELNPSSPKQIKDFLYEELKLPPQIKRSTGKLTADEGAITELAKKYPNPIFDLILEIRGIRKMLSTYIRAPLDEDGRIRCSYVITGTETGRLSSRESVYGSGTNLQNIPRGDIVRGIFIPDKGKTFVNVDLSQAEARVVSYLAKEERMQKLFNSGGDIHRRNASFLFNKREEEVTKEDRQLAKTLVHAANYGIGPRTFSKHIGSTEEKARTLLNQYYAMYPGIKLWHREIGERISRARILRTPLGRARMFFGRWGPDLVKEAIAYIPQSTVSDILNRGLINASNNLPTDWELILQVHDSVLMQVPKDTHPMHIFKFAKHYFEIGIEIERERMVIPIDIKVGDNWADMKKLGV